MRKHPIFDGSKPVMICPEPDMHQSWLGPVPVLRATIILMFGGLGGMVIQRIWHLIP